MTSVDTFINNLCRAKTDRERCSVAADLKHHIARDWQDDGAEKFNSFVDNLNHKIVTLSNSSEVNENKAAVLAIVALIEADSKSSTQPTRYNKSLTKINQSCNDWNTLRLSTWAMGRLARSEGNLYDRFIEPAMGKAFEILDEKVKSRESNDSRKMAAILTIREMAINAPTFFFQKLDDFFDLIVKVLKDPKEKIRFAAVADLRASLTIVAQRECSLQGNNEETLNYYEKLLDGALEMLKRDDEVKGGVMIIIEMLRAATPRDKLLVYEHNCLGGSEDISLLKIIGLSSLRMENSCLINNSDPSDDLSETVPANWDVLGEEGHFYSQQCEFLIKSQFLKIGEGILKNKSSKNQETQFLLTEVLPRLAAFDHTSFQEHFLSDTFSYLTIHAKGVKSSVSSPTVFLAIGQIAFSMKDGIICYMDRIFTVIKPYIPSPKELSKYRRNVNSVVEGNVLQLISLLAKATRDKFYTAICEYIDGLILMTLTKALTDCLAVLYDNVPAVKDKIQDGLLNIFSKIILKSPYMKDNKPVDMLHDYIEPTDVQSKLLAIKTIGEFKFDDKLLKNFITHLAKEYLNDRDPDIRKEAAKTCARKLFPCANGSTPIHLGPRLYYYQAMVTEVLTKLLTVVVADPLCDIRLATLREFNKDFYKPLALSENIQSLFLAVNDESHEVREVVLDLLGHLSEENPAYILPFLRQQLSQILHQFEHSGIAKNKERAAKLLHILIRSAQPTLARLYLKPIMSILLPKLISSECSSILYRHILACIGQLAEVDGETMRAYLKDLFPFLIDKISDLKEREHSLKAMYCLVRHTGYVVKPYKKYPKLLDTLLEIIKTEQSAFIRAECMRLLGQLGALNPYKSTDVNTDEMRNFPVTQPVPEEAVSFNTGLTSELLIQKQSDKDFNLETQYYPCVVIHALMNILDDKSLSEYHSQVIQIIITVFQRLGSAGTVGYLPKVMPTFLENIKQCEKNNKNIDSYFNKLADLTKIVGIHIKPYANDIIKLIKEYWSTEGMFQNTIMMVVERLINALGGEFKTYVAELIPLIMKVLNDDHSPNKEATKRLLGELHQFSTTLDNYLHLLLPQIVQIIGDETNDLDIRMVGVTSIQQIAEYADYSEHASLMIHTLTRSLDKSTDYNFKMLIMQAILAIAKQLGYRFTIFRQLVHSVASRHQLMVPEFESFVTQLTSKDLILPVVPSLKVPPRTQVLNEPDGTAQKLPVDTAQLTNVWKTKNLYGKDLVLWLHQLKIEFLKYTPNPALRACCMLVQLPKLSEDLFNAVFVSLWSEQLTEHQQDQLGDNLRYALENQNIPEVTLTILNLEEFMEHWGKGVLDIPNTVFATAAKKCNAYAKALYYVEKDFLNNKTGTLVELLRINNTLQQPQAALGVLKYAQMKTNLKPEDHPEDSWYEELQQWDEALTRYDEKLKEEHPEQQRSVLGRLRCLEALNRWDEMQQTSNQYWGIFGTSNINKSSRNTTEESPKAAMASLAATSAWRLSNWKDLEKFTGDMQMGYQKHFFSAVSAINNEDYTNAQDLINLSRETLDQEITVIVKEGYHRFYKKMIDMHMLSEIEEVVAFKNPYYTNRREKNEADMIKKREEKRNKLRDIWWERLQGCQRKVEDWSKILEVHKLVLDPRQDTKAWLKFSSIARKSGRLDLAKRILVNLIGEDPSESDNPHWLECNKTLSPSVVYQYLKYQWNVARRSHERERVYSILSGYVNTSLDGNYIDVSQKPDRRLQSKYKLKQGLWLYAIRENRDPNPALESLQYFNQAKDLDDGWYKAWHHWADMNLNSAQPERLKSLESKKDEVNREIDQIQAMDDDDGYEFDMTLSSPHPIKHLRLVVAESDSSGGKKTDDESYGYDDEGGRGQMQGIDEDDDYDYEDDDEDDDIVDSDDEVIIRNEEEEERQYAGRLISELRHSEEDVSMIRDIEDDSSITRLPHPSESGSVRQEIDRERLQELLRKREELNRELKYRYTFITASVDGFIKSITLTGNTNSLQDILRLLTLWFTHGNSPDVYKVLKTGIMRIPIQTWIQVIPQLIARIDIPYEHVRELIHTVLHDVGREHPQALIYPLSVASKSEEPKRKDHAKKLLDFMKGHAPELVDEGIMLSQELIRIAILWNELWHDALERASTKWFNDKNSDGMFDILSPLHKMVNSEPQTELEQSFKNTYGLDLQEAQVWCNRYKKSHNPRHLTQAWDNYYNVYRRIGSNITQLNTLRLEDCSPKLLNKAKDMELAVPGTYDAGQPVIKIRSIQAGVMIIKSKQRPRKLSMSGNDGKKYTFLLKGNEDLRQDERAMQLFALVNSLLANDSNTSEQHLSIQRYSIIPLSPNSGLCGWRPHSDTLHHLIKEHRERKGIAPTLEVKLSSKFCSVYDKLPLMMKIEVFEDVLAITTGEDLACILYQRSPSAEVWFSRRKNYILSHAVMSMVGYILGLGDRHPSNIMMDRKTGNLIHCDFGECFDVARDREKYPEKVPFRLTRMMQKAMEVTGIHGTYTITCNNVMNVLRINENSIRAVLETFVYDPLINWRLVDQDDEGDDEGVNDININKKAVEILEKVKKKLHGYDDITDKYLDVKEQVQSLIKQATASENLCQLYLGWCPFW